jgi:hypothetical protein
LFELNFLAWSRSMLERSIKRAFLVMFSLVFVGSAHATALTLDLVLNPPAVGCTGCTLSGLGTYQIFAEVSRGDNFGLASYNIPVLNVTSLLHRAPRVTSSAALGGEPFPAGFSNFRTSNNQAVIPTGFNFSGAQDYFTPTPYLIRGFGQQASSFAAELPAGNTNSGVIQPSWEEKLLLAEGTYAPGGPLPCIFSTSVDLTANLFADATSSAVIAAILQPVFIFGPKVGDLGPLVGDMSLNPPHTPTIVSSALPVLLELTSPCIDALVWEFVGAATGPGVPKKAPQLDPATGLFSWDVDGSAGGQYVFTVRASDNFPPASGGPFSDTGTVTVNVIVPEPATIAMLGLAVVGLAGLRRRR